MDCINQVKFKLHVSGLGSMYQGWVVCIKVIMQGKLQLRILCVHIETSSLCAEFVNKNRCISVRLVYKEVKKDLILIILIIHIRPEYFIDYLCERWIPCQASTSVLCLRYHPETVHCSTKDAYTSEISFFAL